MYFRLMNVPVSSLVQKTVNVTCRNTQLNFYFIFSDSFLDDYLCMALSFIFAVSWVFPTALWLFYDCHYGVCHVTTPLMTAGRGEEQPDGGRRAPEGTDHVMAEGTRPPQVRTHGI